MRRVFWIALVVFWLFLLTPEGVQATNCVGNPGSDDKKECNAATNGAAALAGLGATGIAIAKTRGKKKAPPADECGRLRQRYKELEGLHQGVEQEYQKWLHTLHAAQLSHTKMEQAHVELVEQHQGAMAYFLAAGAILGAVVAAMMASVLMKLGSSALLETTQIQTVNALGSDAYILTGEFAQVQAAQYGAMANSAGYYEMAFQALRGSLWGGLAGGATVGATVQKLMEQGLEEFRAGLARSERLISQIRASCKAKREQLIDVKRDMNDIVPKLRECGDAVTPPSELPPVTFRM